MHARERAVETRPEASRLYLANRLFLNLLHLPRVLLAPGQLQEATAVFSCPEKFSFIVFITFLLSPL